MAENELFNKLASKLAITLPPPDERRRLREAFQVTQQELADALTVSRRTIHAWETGNGNPTGTNRERYAEILALWQAREQSDPNNPQNRQAS